MPITASDDATTLANALLGPSSAFTLLSATLTGPSGAAGLQDTMTGGIAPGIILTTGSALGATGPQSNLASTDNGGAGSADLESLIGKTDSADASVLTLMLKAGSGAAQGKFDYVFATDDPGTDGSGNSFDDTFAVHLSSVNYTGYVALSSSSVPLSLNSSGNGLTAVSDPSTAYDRRTDATQMQIAPFALEADEVFSLSFAIADFGDSTGDTGVYLANLGEVPPVFPPPPPTEPFFDGRTVDVAFQSALDSFSSDDTITVDSSGAREIVAGEAATDLGSNYLLNGEYVDLSADILAGQNLLYLDISLMPGIGMLTFSGWSGDLALDSVFYLDSDNILLSPEFDFTADMLHVDWTSVLPLNTDLDLPARQSFTLIFSQVPEPASLSLFVVAALLTAFLAAPPARRCANT